MSWTASSLPVPQSPSVVAYGTASSSLVLLPGPAALAPAWLREHLFTQDLSPPALVEPPHGVNNDLSEP